VLLLEVVINIPGCPAHPDWVMETLGMIVWGKLKLQDLDEYQRPKEFYGHLSHHGCPRNDVFLSILDVKGLFVLQIVIFAFGLEGQGVV